MDGFKDFNSTIVRQVAAQMPITTVTFDSGGKRTGLLIVDEIVGFCTVGAGPLAPASTNQQVEKMLRETNRLARAFVAAGRPVMAFIDTHAADRPEDPFPPHCLEGSGHDELVPELTWLHEATGVSILRKGVINGVVGGMRADGSNVVLDWIRSNDLEAIVIVGICTDLCVLSAGLTIISARNHYVEGKPFLGSLRDVIVLEPGTATYDLPIEVVKHLGLPDTAAHPQELSHYMGLWAMQAQGIVIASKIT